MESAGEAVLRSSSLPEGLARRPGHSGVRRLGTASSVRARSLAPDRDVRAARLGLPVTSVGTVGPVRLTGDTLGRRMGEATIRDLRNHGAEVIRRVQAGESVTITRDGEAVAELRPLPKRRLGARSLIEQFRVLPPVDADRLRADVDAVIDRSL
jgi:prevent-host-death family protein